MPVVNIAQSKIIFVLGVIFLVMLFFVPRYVAAQWPPFRFRLTPSYEEGKITYTLDFRNRADWQMRDVLINIPLPEGTRFLEANAQPTTEVSFDGQEVSFFTSVLHRDSIRVANFTVEITDTEKSEFTTQAWIAWEGEGEVRGDYLEDDISIDITQQVVEWDRPANVRLDLDTEAVLEGNRITYKLYPYNSSGGSGLRMWDLKINVPIPEGTTFLSAEASHPFTTDYDGQEVTFFALEVAAREEVAPLEFTVSIDDTPNVPIVTHAWASWLNASRSAIRSRPAVEELVTGDIIVNPHNSQQVASDIIGDVVLPNYDLTSVAFRNQGNAFAVTFYTAGPICEAEPPLEMYLYIDSDCNDNTGRSQLGLGVDHFMRYRMHRDQSQIRSWNAEEEKWNKFETIEGIHSAGSQATTVRVPYSLVNDNRDFCWVARSRYISDGAAVSPSSDYVYASSPVNLLAQPVQQDEIAPSSTPEPSTTMKGLTVGLIGPTTVTIGEPFTVSVVADDIPEPGIFGYQLTLDWDGTALNPVSDTLELNSSFSIVTESSVNTDTLKIVVSRQDVVADLTSPLTLLAIQMQANAPIQTSLAAVATGFFPNIPDTPDVVSDQVSDQTSACATPNQAPPPISNFEDIGGKLAVPLDNGKALYDVHIFSLPDGQEIDRIENARQPNFRPDGQRLLINREGQGIEDVYEYNLETGEQTQVSAAPDDSHPFYDPWGNRVVYGNSRLTVGYPELLSEELWTIGTDEEDRGKKEKVYLDPRKPFIFVQCGLIPPHKESEPRCQEIHSLGKLVPGAQMGEIVGDHPVWTEDDMIAFRGCNTWAGSNLCGIYIVPAGSTRGFSDGVNPRQLTDNTTDTPTDTKGDFIAFSSHRDDNWEAYLMKKDGSELRNLSNHAANDGLPTISPDGQWVAYVSDRDGQWAVWVVPTTGGESRKLFDLPNPIPWGDGDRTWQNERISWGP